MEKDEAKAILKQTIKEMFQNEEIVVKIEVDSMSASEGYTDLKVSVLIDDEEIAVSTDSIFSDYQTIHRSY